MVLNLEILDMGANAACCANVDNGEFLSIDHKENSPNSNKPSKPGHAKQIEMVLNEDMTLKQEVEQIWMKYDHNKNGVLEYNEAYEFLKDMMYEVSGNFPSKDQIDSNLKLLDEDNSGDVTKEEAYKFIEGFRIGQILR